MSSSLATWVLTFLLHSSALGLGALLAMTWLERPAWRAVAARLGMLAGFATTSLALWLSLIHI